MRLRSGSRGSFYGCTAYPRCRATRPAESFPATAPVLASDDAPEESAEETTSTKIELPKVTYAESTAAYNELMARLDDDQRAFVAWTPADGNCRCIACAGAGKTTSVTALISRLIREGVCNSQQIVATTFTSKAGKELAERLNRVLPPGALDRMRVGTFHGLALRALRGSDSSRWDMRRCLDIGKRGGGIPSASKLWSMVLGYAGPQGLPGTGAEGLNLEEPDVRAYALAVDVERSKGIFGTALEDRLQVVERDSGLVYLEKAWTMYDACKIQIGAWDFADALQVWHVILEKSTPTPGLVVIVDEAQDNSEIQLAIARLLAREGSLLLVGDNRQAIYSWRGAAPEIFQTADRIVNATTREIRNNYRSGTSIVELGNRIADGKPWNIGDAAKATRADVGSVTVAGYSDPGVEAREVASKIAQLTHDGAALDDVAILCRTNAASGAFEGALVAASVPCVVVGGQPFFKRYEVQNALAYITLSVRDDLDSLARIVNKPRRYLGAKFVASVAVQSGASLLEKIDSSIRYLSSRQRDAARGLHVFLAALRHAEWPQAADMVARLLAPPETTSGEADADRSGLVAAVASLAKGFPDASLFLDFAQRCAGEVVEARAADGGFELPEGRVTISTIHKFKGLEARHVFVSASSGTFPHSRATGARYAEEERLWYTAVTRAKDTLSLTYSETDLYGREAGPSLFLAYVPGQEVERYKEVETTEGWEFGQVLGNAKIRAVGITVETPKAKPPRRRKKKEEG